MKYDMRHVIGIQWDIPSDMVDFPASHVSKQGHHSQHTCILLACWRRVAAEPRSELRQLRRCGSFGHQDPVEVVFKIPVDPTVA